MSGESAVDANHRERHGDGSLRPPFGDDAVPGEDDLDQVDPITPLDTGLSRSAGIRILHVDDAPAYCELVDTVLEDVDESFEVVSEQRAEDGLERLADEQIDCVVSDYDMPEMDGLEFLEAVRADHPELPFVLLTGKGSEEIASDAIAAGVTEYVQKRGGVDNFELLANRIENAVAKARTERDLWTTLSWYRRLVEQNLAGIYLVQDGEIVYVNEEMAHTFGYEQSELIGASPLDLVAEADRETIGESIRDVLDADHDTFHTTLTGVDSDGDTVEVAAHGGSIEFGGEPAVMGLVVALSGDR